ncbi:type II toxin-antitoxin system VapB family antitoxin [Candidatus Poriferisocius sp.]|uniref:type II toxin-antitoxin system VapB family antitoxin n=1 Tax=Candidatus Poriferisocius sp. TaxID=3101276 RepID=UPI003B02D5A2
MYCIFVDQTSCRTRTNIELDNGLVDIIMRRYGARTKTEAVHLALRHLAGQPLTIQEVLNGQGAGDIDQVPPDRGPRSLDRSSS